MEPKNTDGYGCPLQSSKVLLAIADALDTINGKWRIKIIAILLDSPKRFRELSQLIDNITDRMLSIELKKMEMNNLIQKRTLIYVNHVEYYLTDHGQSLQPLITELIHWGQLHRKKIISSQ